MRSLFRRREPEFYTDPHPLPEVHLVEEPRARTAIDWTPKPDDLTRALERLEWTRPVPVVALDREPAPKLEPPPWLPWTSTPPTEAGVYWFCENDSAAVFQCVVSDFGGRLCVTERAGDSCTYRAVVSLHRYWAGPCPVPEFITLDDLKDTL